MEQPPVFLAETGEKNKVSEKKNFEFHSVYLFQMHTTTTKAFLFFKRTGLHYVIVVRVGGGLRDI